MGINLPDTSWPLEMEAMEHLHQPQTDTSAVIIGRVLEGRWPCTELDLASGHQGDMRLVVP